MKNERVRLRWVNQRDVRIEVPERGVDLDFPEKDGGPYDWITVLIFAINSELKSPPSWAASRISFISSSSSRW